MSVIIDARRDYCGIVVIAVAVDVVVYCCYCFECCHQVFVVVYCGFVSGGGGACGGGGGGGGGGGVLICCCFLVVHCLLLLLLLVFL